MGSNSAETGNKHPHLGSPTRDYLAARLSDLARELQHGEDTESVLAGIVHAALELVPHAANASVSLVTAGRSTHGRLPAIFPAGWMRSKAKQARVSVPGRVLRGAHCERPGPQYG